MTVGYEVAEPTVETLALHNQTGGVTGDPEIPVTADPTVSGQIANLVRDMDHYTVEIETYVSDDGGLTWTLELTDTVQAERARPLHLHA